MAIDLTGGMEASKDHFLAERPSDPDFRESASFWVSDDRGELGLPRIGIEAVASEWDKRGLQLNLGFPGGRALTFCHVEPFKTPTVTYEGPAIDTTFDAMVAGERSDAQSQITVELEHRCATWIVQARKP
jgi:hypothetical protein